MACKAPSTIHNSFHHSPVLSGGTPCLLAGLRRLPRRKMGGAVFASRRESSYGWDYSGREGLVDSNMIVLRMRIHELEMAERNYEPPSHWTEWEKQYYSSYGADVCEFVGVLQTVLVNTRPSVAIGMAALVLLSVPASMMLVVCQLMGASSWIASHFN